MGRDKALSYASNPDLWLTSVSITLACIAFIVLIGYKLDDKNKSIFTKFLGVLFFVKIWKVLIFFLCLLISAF